MIMFEPTSAAQIPEKLEALGLIVVTSEEVASIKEHCTRQSEERWKKFLAKNRLRKFYFGNNPEATGAPPVVMVALVLALIGGISILGGAESRIAISIAVILVILIAIEYIAFGPPETNRRNVSAMKWTQESRSNRPLQWAVTSLVDYGGKLPEAIRLVKHKARETDFGSDVIFVHHIREVGAPEGKTNAIFIEIRLRLKSRELSYFAALGEAGQK